MPSPTPRISASSYSNTAPLVWSFLYGANRGKYELIMDNAPARSAELLAQKRVDAALVPVIEYQRIPDALLVPEVCVGARERVRSVCLVTRGEDLENVRSVALDVSSKTSVALTRIVFREFLSLEPIYREAAPNIDAMLDDADCALLIGDPALQISDLGFGIADFNERSSVFGLRSSQKEREKAQIENREQKTENRRPKTENRLRKFDLAEIWKSHTGFGFVFAMWMAQREKAEIARKIDFATARDEGLAHFDEIVSNYAGEIALERADFKNYLSENISYTIDVSMQKGLALYYELAFEHGLIETKKDLSFIG